MMVNMNNQQIINTNIYQAIHTGDNGIAPFPSNE